CTATASGAWGTTRTRRSTSTSTSRRTPCPSRSRAATSQAASSSRSPRCATTSCSASPAASRSRAAAARTPSSAGPGAGPPWSSRSTRRRTVPDDPRTPPAADVVPAGTGGPLPTAVTPVPDTVYLLPLRRAAVDPAELAELASYLRRLARHLPVVVADASPPEVRQWHAAAWGARVRSIAVPDVPAGTNGKVIGVRTALAATTEPRVVVADDDVRYPVGTLRRVVAVLDHA